MLRVVDYIEGKLSDIYCTRFFFWKFVIKSVVIFWTGGVAESPCPFKCISDRYHMPHCYTALEELVYTFGGPWLFGLILLGLLILLALVLSVARMKYVGGDDLPAVVPARRGSRNDHSFPFLESLNEVPTLFLFDLLHFFSQHIDKRNKSKPCYLIMCYPRYNLVDLSGSGDK